MSPNEQKVTPGRVAMAWARSIISSDVTQTGQPGPWTSSTSGGRTRSMPYLTMVCVWPPHLQLVELVHLAEVLEDAAGLRLVEARQGEADVDEDVVAGPGVADVLQADALADAAEIDLAHQHVVFAVGFDHLAGDAEAHRCPSADRLALAGGRDGQLPQAQAAVA